MAWLTDAHGNKCSVEYWGSKEAAQAALDSLKDCDECINCSRCSGCSRCSDCSDLNNASPVEADATSPLVPTVPIIENLHKKLYDAVTQPDALNMDGWHTCEKTHCRARWVVTLAGAEGKALERFFDPLLAAMKIYDASCPDYKINPARFFDSNEDALDDMRKLAEQEKSI